MKPAWQQLWRVTAAAIGMLAAFAAVAALGDAGYEAAPAEGGAKAATGGCCGGCG